MTIDIGHFTCEKFDNGTWLLTGKKKLPRNTVEKRAREIVIKGRTENRQFFLFSIQNDCICYFDGIGITVKWFLED
jgi:hypothetical protein